jgi:ATP-dependent Zn protease
MSSIAQIRTALVLATLLIAAAAVWMIVGSHRTQPTITYTQFIERVRAGQVAGVEIAAGNPGASQATIRFKDGNTTRTVLPFDYSAALALLEEQLVTVEIQDASTSPGRLLMNATPFFVLLAIWVVLMFNRRRFLRWRD